MRIYKCNHCGLYVTEEENNLHENKCLRCNEELELIPIGLGGVSNMTPAQIIALWNFFGDTPINDNDEIEEDFFAWSKDTNRLDIWKFFDRLYPTGVAGLIHDSFQVSL